MNIKNSPLNEGIEDKPKTTKSVPIKRQVFLIIFLFIYFLFQIYTAYYNYIPNLIHDLSNVLPNNSLQVLELLIQKVVGFFLVWPLITFYLLGLNIYKTKKGYTD